MIFDAAITTLIWVLSILGALQIAGLVVSLAVLADLRWKNRSRKP